MKIPNVGVSRISGESSAGRIRLFEICFTVQFIAWMGMLYLSPFDWLGRDGYHPDFSPLRMGYWAPWPKLPNYGVLLFGICLFGGAALIFRGGAWRRIGFFLAMICSIYVLYADKASAFSVSRLNVLVYAILLTSPPNRIDRFGVIWESVSAIWILRGLLIGLYFTAGVSKIWHGDWLEHNDVIFSFVPGFYRTDLSAFLAREAPSWFWVLQKWLAIGFELGAPVLFGFRKLRPIAIVAGLGFHAFIAVSFYSIWPFSLHCISYYPLFIPRGWLDCFRAKLFSKPPTP